MLESGHEVSLWLTHDGLISRVEDLMYMTVQLFRRKSLFPLLGVLIGHGRISSSKFHGLRFLL